MPTHVCGCVYALRLGGRRHCGYGAGVRVFNQEKRVGTGLKNGLGGETGAWRAYVGEVP